MLGEESTLMYANAAGEIEGCQYWTASAPPAFTE